MEIPKLHLGPELHLTFGTNCVYEKNRDDETLKAGFRIERIRSDKGGK